MTRDDEENQLDCLMLLSAYHVERRWPGLIDNLSVTVCKEVLVTSIGTIVPAIVSNPTVRSAFEAFIDDATDDHWTTLKTVAILAGII